MIPAIVNLVSRLIIGGSGSGKSEGVIHELLDLARQGLCCIILMDPHGLTARKFMLHLIDEGLEHRVLYDRLSSFERVLAGISIEQSNHPNRLKRDSINRARVMALVNIFWRAAQREDDWFDMPSTSKYLKFVFKLILFQPRPEPLSNVQFAYMVGHPEFNRLVESCTDRNTKAVGLYLQKLHRTNNFKLLDTTIAAAERAIEPSLEFPGFRERTGGTFDIGNVIRTRQIIILDGSDDGSVPRELVTATYGCWNYKIHSFMQQNFAETREVLPLVLVWEEAPAINILSKLEENMFREDRKTGVSCWFVGQELGTLSPQSLTALKSCTPNHTWYNPGDADLGKIAAEDIAIRQLDPHLIHSVEETERMLQDGWDYELRETVSETKHGEGHQKTISHTEVPKARYRPVTDKKTKYADLHDQILLKATKMLEMGPGYRMISDRSIGYVSKEPEYIEMLPDPYPEDDFPGLADEMLERAIAESQARPEFKTPVESAETWDETTTSSADKGTKKPSQSLPKPRGRHGN